MSTNVNFQGTNLQQNSESTKDFGGKFAEGHGMEKVSESMFCLALTIKYGAKAQKNPDKNKNVY